MKWMPWPSIENHYRSKEIARWLEQFPQLKEAEYIVTEKIHGSNIQVAFSPDGEVRYGSRNQWLGSDGNFFGCFPKDMPSLFRFDWGGFSDHMLRLAKSRETEVRIYGELYGPGIQKGVNYGGDKRILWFGMRYGNEIQAFTDMQGIFAAVEMVPIIDRVNGLQAALDFNTDFDTHIYPAPGNICEGVVMCPASPVRWDDSWFMLKKKNEAFKERSHAKKEHLPDEVVDPLNLAFRDYITEARMQSVFSKEGPIENKKDIGRYIKLILADAIGDFTKDYPEAETLDKAQKKAVYNVGSTIAQMLLATI